MSSKKYIVIAYGNKYLSDLWTTSLPSNVICLQSPYKQINNPFLKLLKRIHLSARINNVIDLPFKHIWYALESIPWEKDQQYHVFFAGIWGTGMETDYLKRLQSHVRVSYSLLLLDSLSSPVARKSKEFMEQLFLKYIFTFDPKDAEKYGLIHTMAIYSKQPSSFIGLPNKDLYFAGCDNGRHDLLYKIYRGAVVCGAKVHYRLMQVLKRDQIQGEGIEYYKKNANYSLIIEETEQSNCILEIIRAGQSGATLRYYEAVCYNKKLLTNNKNVVNLPFYNPDYIHVFEKSEDIDWNWVKERIPVDYHYDGRFSPTHLIDKIIELEEEKEKQQNAEKETC